MNWIPTLIHSTPFMLLIWEGNKINRRQALKELRPRFGKQGILHQKQNQKPGQHGCKGRVRESEDSLLVKASQAAGDMNRR